VGSPPGSSPFPPSLAPEDDADTPLAFGDERPSESRLHAVASAVAVVATDRTLRDSLSVLMRSAGRVVGGDDIIPVAAVVITDAGAGAKPAVAGLRARTRSDAAIIVVLTDSASATEVDAAYQAGAVLCLRAPVDEHQLLATIDSAIDLHAAKVHADDLARQLDTQAHLASLGRVTAGFTHEVSNPLAMLTLNLEILRNRIGPLLPDRDRLAPAIEESAPPPREGHAPESLSTMATAHDVRRALTDMGAALDRINRVLATARALAQGGLSRDIEDVDLALLVDDVRRWTADELEGVDVQYLVDEPMVARADPQLLRQILLNLVTNAAHAVRQMPSARVRLHVYGSNDGAILSVRDNGPGIPDEIRDKIFEPFFTTRRDHGGTGLGLALCREYAAQMQARISLWTASGRGACFRIHLRRATS
jgi:two-component system, NtrC family, sensor kinase